MRRAIIDSAAIPATSATLRTIRGERAAGSKVTGRSLSSVAAVIRGPFAGL